MTTVPVGEIIIASEDGRLLTQATGAGLLSLNRLGRHGLNLEALSRHALAQSSASGQEPKPHMLVSRRSPANTPAVLSFQYPKDKCRDLKSSSEPFHWHTFGQGNRPADRPEPAGTLTDSADNEIADLSNGTHYSLVHLHTVGSWAA